MIDFNELFNYLSAAWREVSNRKFKVALFITILSFAGMVLGISRPSNFSSSITIFADNQNIIKPLLGNKASVTSVKQNRTAQVRDLIYSPRLLQQVLNDVYGANAFPSSLLKEEKLAELRANLLVKGKSGNYITISYSGDSAERTFQILNKIVSIFIEDSASSKLEESRNAFNFIDQQTSGYKELLLTAENKLKNFQSSNFDGTEDEINIRIATLRDRIEDIKIQVQESSIRVSSIRRQLAKEQQYNANDYGIAAFYTQLKILEQRKSLLNLKYKDTHPDIRNLNYEIKNIKKTITEESNKERQINNDDSDFNPLYKELRSKLADAEVERNTLNNRLTAFNKLVDEAYERRKRIATNQAELSELTRDYSVLQEQYEDMLSKKEKARISMVLDVQGQGVNYKLQEAATYPNAPSGLRFIHFFIGSPIISFFLVFMIYIAKLLVDSKVRFNFQLNQLKDIPVLASFGHIDTKRDIKIKRVSYILLIMYVLGVTGLYVAIAFSHKYNQPILDLVNIKGLLI